MNGRAGWNQPLEVRENPEAVNFDGGRLVPELDWILCEEDHELIKEGRKCIVCMEVFKTGDGLSIAWPTECPVCMFPVAREQQAMYEDSMKMEAVYVGPRTSDADEIERLTEKTERRLHTPGGSILIPRGVKSV